MKTNDPTTKELFSEAANNLKANVSQDYINALVQILAGKTTTEITEWVCGTAVQMLREDPRNLVDRIGKNKALVVYSGKIWGWAEAAMEEMTRMVQATE